jgi:magnesium-transporting ATPase (P-type)
MGLVGFIDPIREDAPGAIKKCREAGIKVIMITGDHPLTAYKIAKDLKLVNSYDYVTTGDELEEYLNKTENEFDEFIKGKLIYTRVTPIQKLKIVESLKRQGEYVAVTGDGVNDAPALKSANIGVAMGSGTDIAKESADMILMDDNFNSIVKGVLEGRVAYSNIRKITYFLISCGFAEVLFFCLSIVFNLPMPLVAIQLLWLNVVTDGIQDFALSFERPEKNIMKERPRSPKENLFDKELMEEILVSGLSIGLIVFALWSLLINEANMDLIKARTYVLALMIVIQNVHAFNARSERNSSLSIPLKSNRIFVYGVIGSISLGILVLEIKFFNVFLNTTSLSFFSLVFLFILGLSIFVIMEIYKRIKNNRKQIDN